MPDDEVARSEAWPWDIPWNAEHDSLARHFGKHGREVGARTEVAYLRLAHETMRDGVRFTYRRGPRTRVGYYHERRQRLVVLPEDESVILSLSRQGRRHVERLTDSSYGKT